MKKTKKICVGVFGIFADPSSELIMLWEYLEDLCREHCGGLFIGVYSQYDVLGWAKDQKVLSPEELLLIESSM